MVKVHRQIVGRMEEKAAKKESKEELLLEKEQLTNQIIEYRGLWTEDMIASNLQI